jgi:cell division protein FtsL
MTARISPLVPERRRVAPRRAKVDLAVVAEQRRRVNLRVGALLAVGVFVVMFVMLASYTLVIGQQQRLDSLNRQIVAEQHEAQDLDAQIAELQSPVRVTRDAAALLGMVPAPTPVYLEPRIDDDQRAGELPQVGATSR